MPPLFIIHYNILLNICQVNSNGFKKIFQKFSKNNTKSLDLFLNICYNQHKLNRSMLTKGSKNVYLPFHKYRFAYISPEYKTNWCCEPDKRYSLG